MYKFLLAALALAFLATSLAVAQPVDKPPQPQPGVKRPEGPQTPPMPKAPKGPPSDPIGDNLFPPELIMKCADQIGLTDEQKDSIKSQMEKAQAGFKDSQQQLEQEVQAMGALLKEDHPDTDKALGQLDKVLAAEREIKRLQITLLIALKNQLTPDQQAQLAEVRQKIMAEGKGKRPGDDVPQPLQIKMQQVQHQVKQLRTEGRDLAPVQQIMQQFEPLMKEKKFAEAEAVLDQALRALGDAAK